MGLEHIKDLPNEAFRRLTGVQKIWGQKLQIRLPEQTTKHWIFQNF